MNDKVFFSSMVSWLDFKGEKTAMLAFMCIGFSLTICKKLATIVVLGEGNLLFPCTKLFCTELFNIIYYLLLVQIIVKTNTF